MTRWMIATSLVVVLALTPFTGAQSSSSSSSGSSSGGGIHGRIQSVAPTNFTVGIGRGHGRHRRHGGLKAIVVHYNPDTVTMTVDGAPVKVLDVAATGKYVSIIGTMKNEVLEATSITVSSSPPAHPKKSKSST